MLYFEAMATRLVQAAGMVQNFPHQMDQETGFPQGIVLGGLPVQAGQGDGHTLFRSCPRWRLTGPVRS